MVTFSIFYSTIIMLGDILLGSKKASDDKEKRKVKGKEGVLRIVDTLPE